VVVGVVVVVVVVVVVGVVVVVVVVVVVMVVVVVVVVVVVMMTVDMGRKQQNLVAYYQALSISDRLSQSRQNIAVFRAECGVPHKSRDDNTCINCHNCETPHKSRDDNINSTVRHMSRDDDVNGHNPNSNDHDSPKGFITAAQSSVNN